MALKDRIAFGMSLPHRSPDTIDMQAVHTVAQRAEALGFRDLWVTENTLDHVTCFDPVVVLTYAAAVTSRIRVGASVVVLAIHSPLMVAHQWATLDYVSNGRAILGVGLGREHHYRQFEVPEEGRVRRFREEVELIRALWSQEKVTYHGRFYHLEDATMAPKPVQKPLPIWMGVGHPDAIRRTASIADGWMGSGGSSIAEFGRSVPLLRDALVQAGRDPDIPDLEADLHGGGRAAGGGARRAEPMVHRGVSQPGRNRRVGDPRHAGTGARTPGGGGRDGRQPSAAEPGIAARGAGRGAG